VLPSISRNANAPTHTCQVIIWLPETQDSVPVRQLKLARILAVVQMSLPTAKLAGAVARNVDSSHFQRISSIHLHGEMVVTMNAGTHFTPIHLAMCRACRSSGFTQKSAAGNHQTVVQRLFPQEQRTPTTPAARHNAIPFILSGILALQTQHTDVCQHKQQGNALH
jgi:hypothetical protein